MLRHQEDVCVCVQAFNLIIAKPQSESHKTIDRSIDIFAECRKNVKRVFIVARIQCILWFHLYTYTYRGYVALNINCENSRDFLLHRAYEHDAKTA